VTVLHIEIVSRQIPAPHLFKTNARVSVRFHSEHVGVLQE
jgi:hypothetical protein